MAQGADGDDRVRRIDRHATAIAVRQAHHIVHMRVQRQQLLANALHRKLHHPRHALHRGGDGQDVARAHAAIGIAVTLKGITSQRHPIGRGGSGLGQIVQATGIGHVQQTLVDPTACMQIAGRMAYDHVVAAHRCTSGHIDQGHLVPLGHFVTQHQARAGSFAGQNGASRQAAIVGHDGHVVAGVHGNQQSLGR